MKNTKRIPNTAGEPANPWLLLKQVELDATPDAVRIFLLTDELGAQCIARGILPQYVIDQAKDALQWCATEERLPQYVKQKDDEDKDQARVDLPAASSPAGSTASGNGR